MELQGIKNIIFDLGEVVINLNPDNTINAFRNLLGADFEAMERKLKSEMVVEKVETGETSIEELIVIIQSFNDNLSRDEIGFAWNSMLLNIPKERMDLINQLASQYRIFLLSNTNELHMNYINEYVATNFNIPNMETPFERAYYSHKMGIRKPNEATFTTILKDNSLLPQETLFIDDTEQHIESAKRLNLKTYHLIKPETIIDIFNAD